MLFTETSPKAFFERACRYVVPSKDFHRPFHTSEHIHTINKYKYF